MAFRLLLQLYRLKLPPPPNFWCSTENEGGALEAWLTLATVHARLQSHFYLVIGVRLLKHILYGKCKIWLNTHRVQVR